MAAPYLYWSAQEIAYNKSVQNLGFSSTINASFTNTSVTGAAFYGGNFYSGANGTAKIKQFTGFSASVASSITPSFTGVNQGFDTSGNLIVVGDTNAVKKYTGFSTTVSASFTIGANLRAVNTDSSNNTLICQAGTVKMYKNTGFSSTVAASFTPSASPRGLAFDGTNYIGTVTAYPLANPVQKYSGFTSTVTSSFVQTAGADAYGLAWESASNVGPANMKTYNTNAKANIKTIDTNPIANIKTFDTNA